MDAEPLAIEFGCFLAVTLPGIGEAIDEPAYPIVKRWIASPTYGAQRVHIVKCALSIEWLKEAAKTVIMQLEAEEFGELADEIPSEIATAAAILFGSAKNWNEANNYANQFAISYASWFSNSDIELIFTKASSNEADLLGSHGFKEFIAALANQDDDKCAKVKVQLEHHGLCHLWPNELPNEIG